MGDEAIPTLDPHSVLGYRVLLLIFRATWQDDLSSRASSSVPALTSLTQSWTAFLLSLMEAFGPEERIRVAHDWLYVMGPVVTWLKAQEPPSALPSPYRMPYALDQLFLELQSDWSFLLAFLKSVFRIPTPTGDSTTYFCFLESCTIFLRGRSYQAGLDARLRHMTYHMGVGLQIPPRRLFQLWVEVVKALDEPEPGDTTSSGPMSAPDHTAPGIRALDERGEYRLKRLQRYQVLLSTSTSIATAEVNASKM
jgi:hypothetical protein